MATGCQGALRPSQAQDAPSRGASELHFTRLNVQHGRQLSARGPSKSPSFLLLLVCYLF